MPLPALQWLAVLSLLCLSPSAAAVSPASHQHRVVDVEPTLTPLPSATTNAALPSPPSPSAQPTYNSSWASLDSRPLPTWYDDAKFGVFIHWGVYSVPGYRADDATGGAEWYWDNLQKGSPGTVAFHNRTYGPAFSYAEFAPHFTAELFNATHWADMFRRAGARYVVPTSKHHEGYDATHHSTPLPSPPHCLCVLTPRLCCDLVPVRRYTLWESPQAWLWNAVQVGPHRDLLNEIMQAVRAAGLHAGLYYSLFEWFNPLYLSSPSTYVDQVMYPQLLDVVTRYAPDVLWSDGDWEQNSTTWRSQDFLTWAFNEAPSRDRLVVNDRWGQGTGRLHGSFYSPEHSTDVIHTHKWELCTTIDVISWGINRAATVEDYLTSDTLLRMLVRTVSNGGNLLLDVGPNADGTIPGIQEQRLLEMGAWLQVNGEAIYATHMYRQQQEGADIDNTTVRYTQSKDNSTLYAHALQWPPNNALLLTVPTAGRGLKQAAHLLGFDRALVIEVRGSGLRVSLPPLSLGHPLAAFPIWVVKLTGFV